MKIKDNLVSWYIQKVLTPKTEDLGNPGFLLTKLSSSTGEISIREIGLPEEIFVELEKRVIDRYGEIGNQVLYSAGKKYGYSYSSVSLLPQLKTSSSEKAFLDETYYLIMYVACSFASEIKHTIDLKLKKFEADLQDYIICKKSGHGDIMSSGGITGIWSYMMDDPTIEGVQTTCMGRGDKKCHVVCSTPQVLESMGLKYFVETDMPRNAFTAIYQEMNAVRPLEYAKNSLEELLSTDFWEYPQGGILEFKGEHRFFICDAHLMYFLESELNKLPEGDKILFEASYDFGKNLARKSGETHYQDFMMDLLPALGYGDLLVISEFGKFKVVSSFFPWAEYFTELKFTLFRGICSGMLSGFTGNKVILDKIEASIADGYLNLVIST